MIKSPSGWLASALFCTLLCTPVLAEQVSLVTSGEPVKKIVIPTTSGTVLQKAAEELQGFLNRMKSGSSSFVVEKFDPAAGPEAATIVLGTAADLNLAAQLDDPALPEPKEREHYLIATANEGSNIVIAGSTDLAVSNGVYDFLERLGCAWFMPPAIWEIVPTASTTVNWATPEKVLAAPTVQIGTKPLALKIYANELPDYKSRVLAIPFHHPEGGNGAHEWQRQWVENDAWKRRNRMAAPLKINNSHTYSNIATWAKKQGRWKPEYWGLVKGKRGSDDPRTEKFLLQFCVSNPEVVQLCKDYAIAWFKEHPEADTISMEPNDGTLYWCECDGCMPMKSGVPNNDYFITDRVVYLANEVAKVIPKGKYVGILSYAKHSGWPSITIEPNVYVNVANGFLSQGMTMPLLLENWSKKWAPNKPNIGIYDYYSIYEADLGLPMQSKSSDLKYMKTAYSDWHNGPAQADTFVAEASYSLGMLGLGQYITSKILWNTDADVEALRKDFISKCFGPPASPIYGTMDQFFKRIDRANGYQLSTDLIGRLFGYINTAYGQTSDPRVIERLDAFALWLKYCEMMRAYTAKEFGTRQKEAEALLRYLWKIRDTSMVDSLAAWKRPKVFGNNNTVKAKDEFAWPKSTVTWVYRGTTHAPGAMELAEGIPMTINPPKIPEAHPWKESSTFSHAEVAAIVKQGMTDNPTLVEEPRMYSHEVIPSGFPAAPRGELDGLRVRKIGLYLYTDSSGAFPALEMSTGHSLNKGDIPYVLMGTDGISEMQSGTLPNDKKTAVVQFTPESPNTPYIFDMQDLSSATKTSWAPGAKVSMLARADFPYSASGGERRYFYVPKGTKNIIAYAYATIAFKVYRLAKPNEVRYEQPAVKKGGVDISFPITEAESGQIWYIDSLMGRNFFFQNIPGVLAASPDELLIPQEVLAKDQPSGSSKLRAK